MARRGLSKPNWIEAKPEGIFIPEANAWIDPAIPAELALITHGHADHARSGHRRVVATSATLDIMALRYGVTADNAISVDYRETIEVGAGIIATYYPAGHVLGSAQICLERQGERVVVTGDYKRRPDPTCAPFEPVACDIFITEATFGLPVFVHPPIEQEMDKLLRASADNPDRAIMVGAYALGKAQRVIAELRRAGYAKPIFLHGALEKMCELYVRHGVELGELQLVGDLPKAALKGEIILCPPSALNDRWSRRLPDPISAMASGWMRVRQRAVQRNVELPLIISDHADWNELTATIREINAAETWITHGREDALLYWCEQHQLKARALAMVGREDEDEG